MEESESVQTTLRMKLVLVFVPTLLLLVLAELVVRAYVWANFGSHDYGMRWEFSYEPYLLVKKRDKFSITYPEKNDQYRVLVLGGSTAAQVPDSMLERQLEAVSSKDIEIINLAQPGYIVNQERIALLLYGIRLAPDMILTLDGANDFVTASKLGIVGLPYQNTFIEMAVDAPLQNAVFAVLKRSQLVNSLNKLRERQLEQQIADDPGLRKETLDHLAEFHRSVGVIADGLEIPYVQVLQPFIHLRSTISEREAKLTPSYDYRKEYLRDMFVAMSQRMNGASIAEKWLFIDATRAFDSVSSEVECFSDQVHLTEDGNRELTRFISSKISQTGML